LELHNWKGIVPRKEEPSLEDIGGANNILALHFPMIITKPWRAENKNVFGPPKFGTKIWTTKRFFALNHSSRSKCWELKVWPKAKKLSTSNNSAPNYGGSRA
jgi:hypothetical protein